MGCNHVAAAAAPPVLESLEGRTLFSTYAVTNALDAGAGSLRQAMLDANKHAGLDEIQFAIGRGVAQSRRRRRCRR